MTTLVTETLGRGRELVKPALQAAIARLDPYTRQVASYHLGWSGSEGRPREAGGGKAIRPALALLAGEAVTGTAEPAVPGAVAVELVHNFSLIHDDLMDRDTERRHRATVWSVWGDATAVLVGDALLSLAHEVLNESGSPYAPAAGRALARATRELIHGQVLDVAFETREDVTLGECIRMAGGKTGALLGASVEIGALLAGAPAIDADAYRRYGEEIGLAFQIVDDLLGIWGEPERTGKPVFSDLRRRKKTLPVVWSIEHGGAAGAELAAWMHRTGEPDEADQRHAAALIERAGGYSWALAEARARAGRALRALDDLDLTTRHRERFDELARFMIERDL